MMKSVTASCSLLAIMAAPATALGQRADYLTRVQQLALDVLHGRVPAYYSSGARERAAALQKRLEEAAAFFEERIGVAPTFALAVLNEGDWAKLHPLPYGIPWVSSSPRVAVLPADLERSVIVRAFSSIRERAPAETLRAVENAGLCVAQAPYRPHAFQCRSVPAGVPLTRRVRKRYDNIPPTLFGWPLRRWETIDSSQPAEYLLAGSCR